jgi:surface polysaccharide O-acyltransferase-like enzyme
MGVSLGREENWEKRLFIDRYWGWWIVGSVVVFMLYRYTANPFLFVISCLVSCLACMALFRWKIKLSGNLWNKLSANAYGIYLVHYLFITWLQFVLLNQPIPVILKFFIVFAGSLTASWLIINWIRKIPVFKKLL